MVSYMSSLRMARYYTIYDSWTQSIPSCVQFDHKLYEYSYSEREWLVQCQGWNLPNNRRAKGETYMPYTSADEQCLMQMKEAGQKLG
jgi:hypothetical protein